MKRDDLIIDAGAHAGEDTEFYLAKGFNVVAVEANPSLAEEMRVRFAEATARGRLRIFNVAIAERSGTQALAVADDMTIWSSLSDKLVRRNELVGTRYHYIDVPAIRFEELLAEVGVPYYLKVDIEGLDMLCVTALHQFRERPTFISIESQVSVADSSLARAIDELAHLWSLGYRRFQYVNQRNHPNVVLPAVPREGTFVPKQFTEVSSGPFGDEAPGKWRSLWPTVARGTALWLHHNLAGFGGRWSAHRGTAAYRWLLSRSCRQSPGWYDLHARLGRGRDEGASISHRQGVRVESRAITVSAHGNVPEGPDLRHRPA
jgi:FkbM family methyltransferase